MNYDKSVEKSLAICYTPISYEQKGGIVVKHIKTISNRVLKDTMKHGGCVNVRHLASQLVRHLAQLVTRAVRIRTTNYYH